MQFALLKISFYDNLPSIKAKFCRITKALIHKILRNTNVPQYTFNQSLASCLLPLKLLLLSDQIRINGEDEQCFYLLCRARFAVIVPLCQIAS